MYVAKQYSRSMVDTIDNVPTTFISTNAYNVRRALSRPLLKQFFFRILVFSFFFFILYHEEMRQVNDGVHKTLFIVLTISFNIYSTYIFVFVSS